MVKYENGKIYRLVCNITGLQYIGSTCSTLSHRKNGHKSNYQEYLKGKKGYMSSFQILEKDNYDIILIENYSCKDKNELHSRERYFIETMECINKRIPIKTDEEKKEVKTEYMKTYHQSNKEKRNNYGKEYRQKNKEKYLEDKKKYNQENKEKIKERTTKPFTCECGTTIQWQEKRRHQKSKKHLDLLSKLS